MNFDTFVKLLTYELSPLDDEGSYKSFFRVISNGKDFILLDDLYNFAEDLDLNLSNEEIEQFFFSFSLNQGTKIEFETFCKFVKYSQTMAKRNEGK